MLRKGFGFAMSGPNTKPLGPILGEGAGVWAGREGAVVSADKGVGEFARCAIMHI